MPANSPWVRSTFITKGADPTEVVEWRNVVTRVSVTEFQNVYTTTQNGLPMRDTTDFWERKHRDLEREWQNEQEGR